MNPSKTNHITLFSYDLEHRTYQLGILRNSRPRSRTFFPSELWHLESRCLPSPSAFISFISRRQDYYWDWQCAFDPGGRRHCSGKNNILASLAENTAINPHQRNSLPKNGGLFKSRYLNSGRAHLIDLQSDDAHREREFDLVHFSIPPRSTLGIKFCQFFKSS